MNTDFKQSDIEIIEAARDAAARIILECDIDEFQRELAHFAFGTLNDIAKIHKQNQEKPEAA